MATTMVDQIATDFVLKVYETKALAEEGNDLNALYVFNNGRDGDTADELVSNGGQFINGTDTSGTSSKLTDTAARFGTRLVGKTVKNTTDSTEATITARDSKIWEHYRTVDQSGNAIDYNNFYGIQSYSMVKAVFNRDQGNGNANYGTNAISTITCIEIKG